MSDYAPEHSPIIVARDKLVHGFTVTDDELKALKYRWEFLRRNDQYKQDYYRCLKEVEELNVAEGISYTNPNELGFCKKWRIGVPVSPKKSYAVFRKYVEEELNRIAAINKSMNPSFLDETFEKKNREQLIRLFLESIIKPVDYFLFPVSGWEKYLFSWESDMIMYPRRKYNRFINKGEIDFTINFNYSQRAIIDELKRIVRIFKKKYERVKDEGMKLCQQLEENQKGDDVDKSQLNRIKKIIKNQREIEQKIKAQKVIPRARKEVDHYDDYLKVWDLRKKKVKWVEIAKKMSPKDFINPLDLKETDREPNPESAERMVKEYKKIADRLINEMALDFTVFTRTEPYSI